MSNQRDVFDAQKTEQKQNKVEITDEMAMDYAIFLYNLYRKAKINYN